MTQKEIIEGNKLLKEFMEIDLFTYDSWKQDQLTEGRYHKDWNWLMLVVEKIENFNNGCTLCIIEDERCHINTQNSFEIDSVGHTKIEAVWLAAVEFIKWYNENIQ